MRTSKISNIVMIALIVIGAIVFLMSLSGTYDPIIYLSYFYVVVGILAGLGGALIGMLSKPESAKGVLMGVGAMLVVFILAYVLADSSDYQRLNTTEGLSKLSDTLLYTFYILFIGAIGAIVFSGVKRIIR
jgi:Na+/proline symporter